MRTKIIQIGNSQGVRIPQVLLKECRLHGTVELKAVREGLVIRSVRSKKNREGWDEIFRAMRQADADDPNLQAFREMGNDFERKDWQW